MSNKIRNGLLTMVIALIMAALLGCSILSVVNNIHIPSERVEQLNTTGSQIYELAKNSEFISEFFDRNKSDQNEHSENFAIGRKRSVTAVP